MHSRSSLVIPLVFLSGGIVLFFLLAWLLSSVTLPFAGAIITAFLFSPIVDWLERWHVPRWAGAFLVMVMIIALIAGALFWLVPLVSSELGQMVRSMPTVSASLDTLRHELEGLFPMVNWERVLADALSSIEGTARGLMGSIPGIVSGMLMTIYYSVIIPFLIFFFLKDGRDILCRFVNLVPNAWFEMAVTTLHQIDIGIGRFLRGIFIENSIIAGLAIIGLTIIGMPSAFFVGLLVGIFNVIPYMGPTIGFIIATVMTLIDPVSNPPLLAVLVVISCVQLADNMLVYPLAIGKSVHMHPVNVIGALLLGGFFLGIFGMLLAVPLATTLVVIYKTFIRAWREYRPDPV